MKMTVTYHLVFAVAAAVTFGAITPLSASVADDNKIESSIQKTYIYKTYLKDDAVTVKAKDGVVTLTGTVAEESHKSLAQETAWSLPGVTRVDNQLTTKAEVGDSDAWILKKVKFVLLFHRNVSAKRTIVAVKEGIVTLTGEASSAAERDLAAEYAGDVDGVKEVKNSMTVAATPEPAERTAGEKLDDASITAQVKTVLLFHRSTSALKTKVETRDGVVMLTGIAKNAAEKALVTKFIGDIEGVTTVKNEMTIEQVITK